MYIQYEKDSVIVASRVVYFTITHGNQSEHTVSFRKHTVTHMMLPSFELSGSCRSFDAELRYVGKVFP